MSIIKHIPRRGFFQYSKQEYQKNAKKCLTSANPKYKELKFQREDDSICKINLFGYPINPLFHFHANEEEESDFMHHIKSKDPDFIMCQQDPMTYLYYSRKFATQHLPLLKDQLEQSKYGVFGTQYKLPIEQEENAQKFTENSLKKIHSMYFPIHWRETIVSIQRLLLLQNPNFTKEDLARLEELNINEQAFEIEREQLIQATNNIMLSEKHKNMFFEVNRITMESTMCQIPMLLCDKPELLNRMQIASEMSLDELKQIFNYIMNRVSKKQGPPLPSISAYYHFSEVFQKPKDEYLNALIRKVAQGEPENNTLPESINVYVGNIHVSPVARLWNTNLTGISKSDQKTKKQVGFKSLEFIHQMSYNIGEAAEYKIEKQALMEALFQTQLWMEPYVQNPFIYISDFDKDFQGAEGIQLKDYFKKVFYQNYTKYNQIVQEVIPKEFHQEQQKLFQEIKQKLNNQEAFKL